jgi:hypothetical protein
MPSMIGVSSLSHTTTSSTVFIPYVIWFFSLQLFANVMALAREQNTKQICAKKDLVKKPAFWGLSRPYCFFDELTSLMVHGIQPFYLCLLHKHPRGATMGWSLWRNFARLRRSAMKIFKQIWSAYMAIHFLFLGFATCFGAEGSRRGYRASVGMEVMVSSSRSMLPLAESGSLCNNCIWPTWWWRAGISLKRRGFDDSCQMYSELLHVWDLRPMLARYNMYDTTRHKSLSPQNASFFTKSFFTLANSRKNN